MALVRASHRLLQANINHSVRAQDLLLQTLTEWLIDLTVVTEPYNVLDRPNWHGDERGSVAIIGAAVADAPPLDFLEKGEGYVAVNWGGTTVVGVYSPPNNSPNGSLEKLEHLLEEVGALIYRHSPSPALIMGDLNAKSANWGSPGTDARGRTVWEWAVGTDLHVLNRGSVQTCVRQWGGVDYRRVLCIPHCRAQGQGLACRRRGGDAIRSPLHSVRRLHRRQ